MQAVLVVFRVFCRQFGFAADWENWGENDRMSEGVGGRGRKNKTARPQRRLNLKTPPN